MRASLLLLALVASATGPAFAQSTADSAATPLRAGVYTTDQARAGSGVFRQVCAQCHAQVQFSDATFLKGWSGRSARDLFEMVRTQMPLDNPGTLKREEYAAVLAYLFQLNGLPAGQTALPTDTAALRRIRIEPQP